MKNRLFILLTIGIVLSGCSNAPKFEKQEALQIINKELNYPKVLDYAIFCSDPEHARRLLDAGLEAQGLVAIQKTQKLKDIGNPLIQFTEKAKPYLLYTSDKDRNLNVQQVKIADEEVTNVEMNTDKENKNKILVTYTTGYKNITPFSVLMKRNLNVPIKHTVYFLFSKNEWHVQKSIQ